MCGAFLACASEAPGVPPKDAKEAFERSAAVFAGTVTAVQNDRYGFASIAEVNVQKVWKGMGFLELYRVRVDGQGGPTYPARIFTVGRKYLFFVDHVGGESEPGAVSPVVFRADSFMNRVLSVEEAALDMEYFDKSGIRGVDVTGAPFPKWQACQADSECMVVEAECPGWKPVNRAFKKEMEAHMAYKRPLVDCVTAQLPAKPRVACLAGMCKEQAGL